MALVLADRVRETTTTAGTGTITLLGAVPSCQSFAVVGNGNTTYYTIVAYTGTEYEVGIGTYTSSGTTLSRDTVLASSNGGSLVNFSAGTKDVFVDYPAGRAVYEDAAGNVDGYPITGGTINNTVIGGTTPAAGTFTTLTAQNETLKGTGQNLIFQSQTYTHSSWFQSTVTRLDNQTTAPDGSSTAGTITSTNTVYGGLLRQTPVLTATTYTISAYVKKNNWSYVGLRIGSLSGAADRYAYFNFDTLATSTNGISGATFTATSVGSGWYRIALSGLVTASAGGAADVAVVASDGSSATNNGAGQIVYVWGVQLELGSVANTYIPTTTSQIYGTPTLSFSGVASIGLQSDGSLYETSAGTGNVRFYTNNIGQEQARVSHTASAVNYVELTGAQIANAPTISSKGSDTNISFAYSAKGTGGHDFYTAGTSFARQFTVANTASAVNFVNITGAATGGNATISAQGSDTNLGLSLSSKGTRAILFYGRSFGGIQFATGSVNSAVNYFLASGAITGNSPVLLADGSDTNISQVFQSKGTGAIDLAAGSSGVNISNGGTVTALTQTASGGSYTSIPSVAISAPTTAGGTQATASVNMQLANTPTVTSGGTGYTNGDVLTIVGGTFSAVAQLTVTAVSGGVITAATISAFGTYTVLPSSPVSVTGGTGSSATFTVTWGVRSLTITNAGSGYVEQPTVTFSGGGGSSAAAYATVGSNTLVKSIGNTIQFSTPAGIQAQISDSSSATPTAYPNLNGSTFNLAYVTAVGSAGNAGLILASKGTSAVDIYTNSTGSRAASFVHTASAVNYLQVTGAATGGVPAISMQGSDANITMRLQYKGNGGIQLSNAAGWAGLSVVTANNPNYFSITGNASGTAPVFAAVGVDTNIPLVLQPKGTGALQAQQTDSTATGGNARGANAVDWQTLRSTNSMVASGAVSVLLGGQNNTSSNYTSFMGAGANNTASGANAAVVAGNANLASGQWSFVGSGAGNASGGYYNFVGSGFTNSGTSASAVTTQSATMNATTAVTLSGSNASIKVGQYITGTSISGDTYVAAISGTSLTLSKVASGSSTSTLSFFTPHGVVVGGGNNQATGSYSFIGGGGDAGTAANRNVASGDFSAVVGGWKNTASGLFSGVLSGTNNVASGSGSVVCGGGTYGSITQISANTASGLASFVGAGFGNTASSNASFVGAGKSNVSNGLYSFVGGGTDGTTRAIWGSHVIPALNPFSGVGTSQSATLVLGKQTTDATATVLTVDGGSASTVNQVILPNNSAYYFKGSVIANVTGAANGASWSFEGAIMRGANAASTVLMGTPAINRVAATAGATAWAIALTADTTNGGLAVTVTGAASTTIRWVCKAETTEVTF